MIPSWVKEKIDALKKSGYEAYLVGGSVRDIAMGKNPFDYDITTSALPDEIKKVFKDEKTVDTGLKHGTVTLVTEKGALEITTFRIDGEYKDSRHPQNVTFTRSLYEDLARRDFTINAMATDGKEITDPFGGRKDLEGKILRCVGDPYKRFSEDALRIMRCLRFAAILRFDIEEETKRALIKCAPLLKNVSAERLFAELKKLLSGMDAEKIIVEYFDVFSLFLKGLKLSPGLNNLPDAKDNAMRLALFLLNSPECEILALLKSDKKTERDVSALKNGSKMLSSTDRISLKRLMGTYPHMEEDIILFSHLSGIITEDEKKALLNSAREIKEKGECFSIKTLAVSGSDLEKLGIKGKDVGETLSLLLSAVIEGRAENEKYTLLDYLKRK